MDFGRTNIRDPLEVLYTKKSKKDSYPKEHKALHLNSEMNEQEVSHRLEKIESKLDALVSQAEKAQKMKQMGLIITIIFFILPVILLLFMLPKILGGMTANLEGLL